MTLHRQTFNIDDLIKIERTAPWLAKVYIGNKVEIASGGPEMTVYDISEDGETISVNWLSLDGTMQYYDFPLACLTCYGHSGK